MPQHIQDLIDMAVIYFEDGAPHTAADRLTKAADEMRKVASERDAQIQIAMLTSETSS